MNSYGRLLLSSVFLGACAAIAAAGFTTALDPLAPAVTDRMGTIDVGSRSGRRDLRRLAHVSQLLQTDSTSVKQDLRVAGKIARILDRRLRQMVELGDLLDDALEALDAAGSAERDGLAVWQGRLQGAGPEARLAGALAGFDTSVGRARAATSRAGRARHLRLACARIAHAARRLGIDPHIPPPNPDALPAFALEDVNPSSATFRFKVSPRDFGGHISAWYFGNST